MEELDLLKKDWKRKENSFSQLSENELLKMLHRKSSSIVKWILIISVIEMAISAGINIIYSNDDYLRSLHHEELLTYLNLMNWINYGVTLVFIYLFYRNYVNISSTSSTRQLMKDILRTRKTVQYYVWFNLTIIVLSFITGIIMALMFNPDVQFMKAKMMNEPKYMAMILGIMIVIIVVVVVLVWLFYRLIYGILLRKLLVNYKELKKMDLD
ncbi:MAG: hypothetical protein EOO48_13410 [Flavobacterium sp.]|nr:MAG: hypothetical protein EOO48_13410 [Flavobacterium sp.]